MVWYADAADSNCTVLGTTNLLSREWMPVAYARTAGHTGTTQLPAIGPGDVWADAISIEREIPAPLAGHPGNVFLDNEEVVFPFPAALHSYANQWFATDETGAQVASGVAADGMVRAGALGIGWYRFDFPLTEGTSSVYPTMLLRGTFNGWSATPMVRVANDTWRGGATFHDADPRFKFDVLGEWTVNFGDNNADGIADANGADIPAPFGNGSYVITFNDQTRAYSVEWLTSPAGGTANWTTVAVLASPSGPTPQDSPFGMDGALSWFSHSDDTTAAYARLAALAGVNWIRDRTSWSDLEPARNAFAPASTQYDRAAAIQSGDGLKVLQVLHDLPAWATDATLDGGAHNCFPRDLRDAYRFYHHLAQRFDGNVHAFEPWNEADIEAFGGHVVDERCSFQKAAFLAIKAADTNLVVGWNANAKFASAMDAEGVIRNETWPYFDTFNIHSYDHPEQYGDRMESTRHAACGKPVWITECGIYAPAEPNSHELNVSNQVRQASFFARSFASLQHAGVNRYFAFLLPNYHEAWNNSQYGLLRADLTPRPAYVACAAIGRLLADARPLGRHQPPEESALRLYAFRAFPDGVEHDVLVVWATNSISWSLPGNLAVASLHDVLGRPLAAWPTALDERAVFAVLPRGEAAKLELEKPHTPSFRFEGEASPVVMQLEMPRAQNRLEHGARLLTGTSNLPVHVYNFGTETVHGTVQVEEAPPGWIGGSPEWSITLAPMERQTIHLPVTMPNGGRDAAFGGWIKLRGEFGPAGRPALTFRLINELLNVEPGSVVGIPSATNAAAWQNNIAAGGTLGISNGETGVVFDAQFAAQGDAWAYPSLELAPGERPSFDSEGLILELEVLEGGGTFRALFQEENGSVYECGIWVGGPPENRAVLLFSWAQAVDWAPPDDNGQLDPDKIVRISIGVNAGPGERVQWRIHNLRWARWTPAASGESLAADREARVAEDGVLRWADDNSEVSLLGVNLYSPFSIDHAEVQRLGLDPKQVIRDDVAHLRRLGLGCIRIHCFDRQISDAEGNLLDNEHLALLDFLIDDCGRNGLYTVLTPIAWWGGGRGQETTQGFSDLYAMPELTANRETWPIQARFLRQFAEHVNRHTGRRYADDPFVLAFECINEPLYPPGTPDSLVTEYIDTLVDALKASGTAKPVFYNSWHGRNAAAGASRADGVTCATYPSGLLAGGVLNLPQLARVYESCSSLQPDASIAGKPRMAYEFDAADVAGSYMFPAIAKMFRAERVQVAAQFQYDLLPLADMNANWQTHHLNLVYTPGKALSLAIAAEVFTRVPLGERYVANHEALAFPPFRVSVAEDISELVTTKRYLHSNATQTPPHAAADLERVWGCGPSPVVAYDGNGAYFLDRVSPGLWRLQVYPDVFTVADPYTGGAWVKVRVVPTRRTMTVHLPDLGGTFRVLAFDGETDGPLLATAHEGSFEVSPGDYLLTRLAGIPDAATLQAVAAVAPRFVVPSPSPVSVPLVRASVPPQWRAGEALELRAEAVFATNLTARLASAGGDVRAVALTKGVGHGWTGTLPAGALTAGRWSVTFRAEGPEGTTAFPESSTIGAVWRPTSEAGTALVRVPPDDAALQAEVGAFGSADVSLTEGPVPGGQALKWAAGAEAAQGGGVAGYTLPFAAASAEGLDMEGMGLRIVARGGGRLGTQVEIGFQMSDGAGLGYDLWLGSDWSEFIVPATELQPRWGLPSAGAFQWQDVGQVSVLTGEWLWSGKDAGPQVFELASMEWVPIEPALPLNAAVEGDHWALFYAMAWMRAPIGSVPLQRRLVKDDEGRHGVHLGMATFEGEHGSVSLRVPCDGRTFAQLWQTDGADAVLNIRARGAYAQTTAFELVLVESCGVAWGLNVPLTQEWQTVRVPLRNLWLYAHWDATMPERAGEHLRLSRLESISFCFGKWLYPQAADAAHAVEIAEISLEVGDASASHAIVR